MLQPGKKKHEKIGAMMDQISASMRDGEKVEVSRRDLFVLANLAEIGQLFLLQRFNPNPADQATAEENLRRGVDAIVDACAEGARDAGVASETSQTAAIRLAATGVVIINDRYQDFVFVPEDQEGGYAA